MRRGVPASLPPARPARPRTSAISKAPPETVDPGWILKALAAVVALGVLCSYLTVCLLFYIGQWQFVLHPSRALPRTPASVQLAFDPVHFGDDLSGQPQLNGWWLPGDSSALAGSPTILMLHGETGSMSDALPTARALHDAGLNVLLFDYRGYGESRGRHPSQSLMEHDAESGLQYLAGSGRAPGGALVYGQGLAASLAAKLCAEHPEVRGLILDRADGDTLTRVEADQRSRLVPIALLFHERFPLADRLSTLRTPKLLISYTRGHAPVDAERAPDPKLTVELDPDANPAALTPLVRRFLDTYVTVPPQALSPTP